jgi:hypothetical protein
MQKACRIVSSSEKLRKSAAVVAKSLACATKIVARVRRMGAAFCHSLSARRGSLAMLQGCFRVWSERGNG